MSIKMGRAFFRPAWLVNLASITSFCNIFGRVVSQTQDLIRRYTPFISLDGKNLCPRPTLLVSLLNVLCVLFQMFLLKSISQILLKSHIREAPAARRAAKRSPIPI